ncbi:hypothetical protein J5N97_017335 [Dioscorea zingiberensis]|uniref:RSE1/DDB1/CPSF1 C-terminal domain-containing protein n=1 Tax=Dioscorea zingiberensis TaxID=325984 RepID=A0A9D5CNR1_9LILI|nr:hypothetical protein J5N97_017335 [Dioscorea zingiberensis]
MEHSLQKSENLLGRSAWKLLGWGERKFNNAEQMENGGGGGGDEEENEDTLSDEQYGYPKSESQKWVSCIRILDPRTGNTTCILELQDNEAAFSVCTVNFHDKEHGTLLAVGTAKGLQFWPKRSLIAGFIHIYRFVEEGKSLELLHKTQVEGVPLALCQFQGRLLAGIGQVLRLYDLGKRRLLRKCENKLFPNTIMSIHTYRDRIYVGDIQESFHYCKYRRDENQLYIFADDSVPRWLTASHHIDFGYHGWGRQDVSDEIEEDPTGGRIKWEQGKLNGAPNKVEEIVQFHVGDLVTCLQKASLIPGGGDCIIYGTVMGSLGALLAFASREDVDFFSHLEMHMRQEHPPLCGRDHISYRSAYFPVKDVIDGDLCEQYPTLPPDMQRKIADELDRTPGEILKKLEDVISDGKHSHRLTPLAPVSPACAARPPPSVSWPAAPKLRMTPLNEATKLPRPAPPELPTLGRPLSGAAALGRASTAARLVAPLHPISLLSRSPPATASLLASVRPPCSLP